MSKRTGILKWALLFLRGAAMGAADVVPGVSGGTVALLTGIYSRLIDAVSHVDIKAFKLFFTGKFREFWEHVDGTFLVTLISGIGLSLFTLGRVVHFLLANYPILIWSFFFGLVLASTVVVLGKITKWSFFEPLLFVFGAVGAFFVTGMAPVQTPDGYFFIFLSGAIAICAMILPGISGSLILVLLGKYSIVLGALTENNFLLLFIFASGCMAGIIGFSRLLHLVLHRWWNQSVAILAGFMLGSLNKVWPWKETLKTFIDRHGEVQPLIQKNLLPWIFEQRTGITSLLWIAIICAIAGLALVFGLEWVARQKRQK